MTRPQHSPTKGLLVLVTFGFLMVSGSLFSELQFSELQWKRTNEFLGSVVGNVAWAQEEEPEITFDEEEAEEGEMVLEEEELDPDAEVAEGEITIDTSDLQGDVSAATKSSVLDTSGDTKVSWQDIVVVVRKPFLKVGRLELLPTWGVTMNDNLIRHVQFAGQINYFLTDVLAVGVEGGLYADFLLEPYDLVARQSRRLPTVNKYNWSASLNFHYVPVYGKFAVFDKHLIHWETFFTAGVGVTESEVVPRDPAFNAFKNTLITPNVGASMRFFINKFLTVNIGIRDYVFVDKFEAVGRDQISAAAAKENADSALINNVVFQAGVSFWFPTSFEYTTFR